MGNERYDVMRRSLALFRTIRDEGYTPGGDGTIAINSRISELEEEMRAADEAAVLRRALEETWRIIESAGIGNLANGVQLGPTAWLIKCCDARDLSKSAIAKAKGGDE